MRQPPTLAEPAARSPLRDPVFGSCLVRVTDRQSDLTSDDASRGLKNEYSRVQAFNADGSRILVRGTEWETFLYDASSLQPLGRVPAESEPRWDAEDPDRLYFTDETRLIAHDVSTGQDTLVHEFADGLPRAKPGRRVDPQRRPALHGYPALGFHGRGRGLDAVRLCRLRSGHR